MSLLRSGRTAWVLLIVVGALALHLYLRLLSAEEEFAARSRELEDEVRIAIAQERVMAEAVRTAAEEQQRLREAQEQRRREALTPMPEGVRLALVAFRECLREEGHEGLRVLRARSLDGDGLRDVELWDYDPEQLLSTLYVAGRMEMVLDRGSASLALRFFDGYLSRHGEREDFPREGFELLLPGVNGPMWEARLPYLVRAVETYPEDEPGPAATTMDRFTRHQWRERIDLLLDEADTTDRMRIGALEGLEDGSFRKVQLLGYDDKSLLVMAADADRMAVRVDETAGIVQLVLTDGVLRNAVGETPIGESGYRILLAGVSPGRARDIMMGMVTDR